MNDTLLTTLNNKTIIRTLLLNLDYRHFSPYFDGDVSITILPYLKRSDRPNIRDLYTMKPEGWVTFQYEILIQFPPYIPPHK